MKYIMFQDTNGRKIPFIFPSDFVHAEIAELIQPPNSEVISAGEIKISVHNCNGKSTTLGVGVIKGDAKLIHEYDYFFGFDNLTEVNVPITEELFNGDKE